MDYRRQTTGQLIFSLLGTAVVTVWLVAGCADNGGLVRKRQDVRAGGITEELAMLAWSVEMCDKIHNPGYRSPYRHVLTNWDIYPKSGFWHPTEDTAYARSAVYDVGAETSVPKLHRMVLLAELLDSHDRSVRFSAYTVLGGMLLDSSRLAKFVRLDTVVDGPKEVRKKKVRALLKHIKKHGDEFTREYRLAEGPSEPLSEFERLLIP